MPVSIVVGGQFGSEGKGKVTCLLARRSSGPSVVRCGGPNSGHTTNVANREIVLRQLPAAAGQPDAMLYLSAGCVVDEDLLVQEIETCRVARDRIVVDRRAVLVSHEDIRAEQSLSDSIGSTASGTGAALSRRMLRGQSVRLAGDSAILNEHAQVGVVGDMLQAEFDRGGHIIVEGTQGFGLSLFHGDDYPYLTSRDTTAAAFASEVGLSPRQVDSVVMVVRTFPIRVGGASGPLPDEIDWEAVAAIAAAPNISPEYTSVTRRLRRVAKFDTSLVERAALFNRPTNVAIMGLDRLDYANHGMKCDESLSPRAKQFIRDVENCVKAKSLFLGTGPGTLDAIDLALRRGRNAQ